jgi:hypothetical protein
MLGETSALLLDRYKGDLRRLREEAGHQPATERKLIKECKGIGDVGADIFFREVQRDWSELFPFADKRALQAAKRFGLATMQDRLSGGVTVLGLDMTIAA